MAAASAIANDNPAIVATLRTRGLCLARVSGRDTAANERRLSEYRQYIKDHPEDARRNAVRQPNEVSEGQLVLVAVESNQPTIYLFSQVLTVNERGQLREYIVSLDRATLPSVTGAAGQVRAEAGEAPHTQQTGASMAETGLTVGAIAKRWGYSRQGVQKLARRPDFPPPCFIFNRAKIRIWAVEDVERYERDRPELRSEDAKRRKIRGYGLAVLKRRATTG